LSDAYYQDDDWSTVPRTAEGVPRIAIMPANYMPPSPGDGTDIRSLISPQPVGAPNAVQQLTQAQPQPQQRGILDKLLGLNGLRYETWPERLVRSALTLPGEVYQTGQVTTRDPYGNVTSMQPEIDPRTGYPSEAAVQRVQDLSAFAGLGSMPAAMAREGTALGMGGGRAVQPELPAGGAFHSAVEHALTSAPQDKMTADQWQGWLRNQPGVKQEELDWLNFPAGKQAMTKSDMLAHAQGHGPQLQEVEKSGTPLHEDSIGEEADHIYGQWHPNTSVRVEPRNDGMFHAVDGNNNILGVGNTPQEASNIASEFRQAVQEQNPDVLFDWSHESAEHNLRYYAGGAPKYSDYQLPGGDNYRELLLTMPNGAQNATARYDALTRIADQRSLTDAESNEMVGLERALVHQGAGHVTGDIFQSSHWDEPNVLVHMRMNDRVIPDVGKSLHLEEVQSDWHQAGRKQGYRRTTPPTQQEIEAKASDFWNNHKQADEPTFDQLDRTRRDEYVRAAQQQLMQEGVPDAPFKTTWADLALKRAITKAAREGYDAISWTPGEQQAERYDLSKKLSKVSLGASNNPRLPYNIIAYDKGGHTVLTHDLESLDKLEGVIGKEPAQKLINKAGPDFKFGDRNVELDTPDLKVGGEGMKKFYDKMLVDKANAIGKKFGAKVEYKSLPPESANFHLRTHDDPDLAPHVANLMRSNDYKFMVEHPEGIRYFKDLDAAKRFMDVDAEGVRVPVLRLTPKMKDVAQRKGFPLFMHGSPFMFTPVNGNPFQDQEKR